MKYKKNTFSALVWFVALISSAFNLCHFRCVGVELFFKSGRRQLATIKRCASKRFSARTFAPRHQWKVRDASHCWRPVDGNYSLCPNDPQLRHQSNFTPWSNLMIAKLCFQRDEDVARTINQIYLRLEVIAGCEGVQLKCSQPLGCDAKFMQRQKKKRGLQSTHVKK